VCTLSPVRSSCPFPCVVAGVQANFSWSYTHPQLQCGGIVEALRVLKLGYPSRCAYGLVHSRYRAILRPNEPPDLNKRDFCEAVLAILGEGQVEKKDYQMGLTKVFFRPGKQAFMEELLKRDSALPDVTIKRIKRFLRNKRLQRARASVRVHCRFAIRLRRMRAFWRFNALVREVRVINLTMRTCSASQLLIERLPAMPSAFCVPC
jgi:myosin heavy subunit